MVDVYIANAPLLKPICVPRSSFFYWPECQYMYTYIIVTFPIIYGSSSHIVEGNFKNQELNFVLTNSEKPLLLH